MSLFAATVQALAPLFLLILLGYALKRLRILHPAQVPVLNGLVLNVTLPALIIKGLTDAPCLLPADALAPLALLGAQAVTLGFALMLGCLTRLPRPTWGGLMMTGTFGNTGFLGYPITLALLPHQFPVAVLLDQFGMSIALYLSAPFIGARFGASQGLPRETWPAVRRFLRSPLFLSVIAGVVLRLLPWPPAFLHMPAAQSLGRIMAQCLTYIGQATTPVVLLALGVALRPGAARAYILPISLSCLLKLLACPLAMWMLARAFGLHGETLAVGVLLSAMPTSVMASVLCGENDLSGDYAVATAFVATVASAATVPFLMSVLR